MALSSEQRQMMIVLSRKHTFGGPATREMLETAGRKLYPDTEPEWAAVLDTLVQAGEIAECSGEYAFTAAGETTLEELLLQQTIDHYNQAYELFEVSSAMSRYCELTYGKDLSQMNLTDMDSLNILVKTLRLSRSTRVLDLGCGNGRIDEYIADLTGARITGLDVAPRVIELANARAVSKRLQLEFQVRNMETLDYPPGYFDRIIAIDSLYSVSNLQAVMERTAAALTPRGEMGIFFGNNGRSGHRQTPEDTRLGSVLKTLGLEYQIIDFSVNIEAHWTRSRNAAESLKAAFASEGLEEMQQVLVRQAELNLKNADSAVHYLFHISV